MGSLEKRFNKAYDSRNSGGTRKSALDWSKVENVKFYKLKEGVNKIDIVPYFVKSNEHPLVKSGDLKIGDMDYVLDIWVHKNIGPADTDVVCLKKNYGKACPVCDQSDEYRKQGKQEESDAYKAKRRVFYNVVDLNAEDEGIQVLEQSHFKFEKELLEEARAGDETQPFYNPDKGVSVKFRGSAGTFKGGKMVEPKNFSFIARDGSITKLVKKAISFDELITLHNADDLFALMNGVDDDEEDAAPRKATRKAVEEDDEEEAPKPRSKKPADDDDDEDDDPKPKTQAKDEEDETPKCPAGHKFGKDNDETPECEACPPALWRQCAKAKKNM